MPWPASNDREFWRGVTLTILLIVGTCSFCLAAFVIPKFEQIYRDALPGWTLPEYTRFVLAARIPLALIALAWPIAGIIMVRRQHWAAMALLNSGVLATFLQVGLTVYALFNPLIGLEIGMSDATSPP